MQLLALDAKFQPVAYLEFTNLQWTREYYTVGQFSAQLPPGQYSTGMKYVYRQDRPETGIIQKVELERTPTGERVQISGYFLEDLLTDRAVWPPFYATGSLPAAVIQMIRTYAGDLPRVVIEDAPAGLADDEAWQEVGGAVSSVAYTRLRTQQRSLRARYNYQTDTITVGVWQGLDRTQSQEENSYVVFSDGFGTLAKLNASRDESNHRNYAVIAGEGEGSDRITETVDHTGGGAKKEIFIDSSSYWDKEAQTEAQYRESLRQEAEDTLLEYQVVSNVDVDVSQSGFRYTQDYDLGDKVDFMLPEIGLEMEARIVTVREVYKQGYLTITVELGDKKLTRIQKARLKK